MNRRLSFVLAVVGVTSATVAAAFATNAAFSSSADSSAVAAVSGIGTVPEVATSSSRSGRPASADATTQMSDHTYSVRDAGKVILRQRATSLAIVEAIANSGWRSESAKSETRLGVPVVEVSFVRGTTQVVFTALLVDNSIIARDELRAESSSDAQDGGEEGREDKNEATTPGTGNHNGVATTTAHSDSESTEPTEPTENTERDGHDGPEPTDAPEPTEAPEAPEAPEPPETEN